jgi:hypothetical protein
MPIAISYLIAPRNKGFVIQWGTTRFSFLNRSTGCDCQSMRLRLRKICSFCEDADEAPCCCDPVLAKPTA